MFHDEANDFDRPQIAPGHPLRPHVLYRVSRGDEEARTLRIPEGAHAMRDGQA